MLQIHIDINEARISLSAVKQYQFFFLLFFFLAYLQSNQVMGWGEKAIELRSVETGNLEGVFMHKKAQKLKFLCERNDKVKR